jgi:hypothetical protein
VSPESWPWPDSLDAVIAAPEHHKLILENERVRVLDTHIPVGVTVPVHTHRFITRSSSVTSSAATRTAT